MFVHGCFWHQHPGCKRATIPKTNTTFWREKFSANRARDVAKRTGLRGLGWYVIEAWQCEVERNTSRVAARIERVVRRRSLMARSASLGRQ